MDDGFDIAQKTNIEGLLHIKKRIIRDHRGSVMHVLRADHEYFRGNIGEIYFSTVKPGIIKGWKRHKKMVQRYVVPLGGIKFAFYDDRDNSPSKGATQIISLGSDDYSLLIVPPLLWYSFRGEDSQRESMICNCASIPHEPVESESLELEELKSRFDWSSL